MSDDKLTLTDKQLNDIKERTLIEYNSIEYDKKRPSGKFVISIIVLFTLCVLVSLNLTKKDTVEIDETPIEITVDDTGLVTGIDNSNHE